MTRHRLLDSFSVVLLLLLISAIPSFADPTIPGFTQTVVASGLSGPTAIAFLPDGRFLVAEQSGGLYVVANGVNTLLNTIPVSTPCFDFEAGLLGIAVDPDFSQNHFVYLYRTNDHGNACQENPTGWTNEVVRVTMGPGDTVDLGSLTVILSGIRCDTGYHNGGGLRIGPDGKLYISVGENGVGDFTDQGPGSSTNPYAQDLDTLEGKVLRINIPNGAIPSDNPYANQSGKRGEIWASGFRNPWRFGFDPTTDKLWLGDVGEDDFEELDIVTKGGNYSWPHCEGDEPSGCREQGEVAPIYTYSHQGSARAIMGGAFSGCSFGSLAGYYFFGELVMERIEMIQPNASHDGVVGSSATFVTEAGGPVDIVFGPDGALYYVANFWGEVRRVAGPGGTGSQPIGAKKLILKTGSKKGLNLLSQDEAIVVCGSDPRVAGASVHVFAPGFDDTYTLPASGWTPIVKSGKLKGYNYKDPDLVNGPIHVAQIKDGKLKVIGKGEGLGHVLGETAPIDVDVTFVIGEKQYCMEFEEASKYTPFKLYKVTDASAPTTCK